MTKTSIDARRIALFDALRISDSNGLPKYRRVTNTLIEAFQRGLWRPGEQLPAEEVLAKMTSFSLGTVQRALRDLADQRLVVRQHGFGNFVAETARELQNPWHCRFVGDDGVSVLPIYTQALQRTLAQGAGPWTAYFHNRRETVMQIDRMISVNEEFKIFSRFYADRMLLKRLWATPLEQLHGANFKQMIARHLPITDITRLIQTVPFDTEVCRQIELAPGTTGILLQAIARAGRDLCVYYQEFFVAPSSRRLAFVEDVPAIRRKPAPLSVKHRRSWNEC